MKTTTITLILSIFAASCSTFTFTPEADVVVISVVGTNDVHGELIPQPGRGGITTFSGYVAALRDVRADNGAVLLVDAGDMWQGTLESNLNEGSLAVEAYNALGYAAAAIGNHEFDFGPAGPKSIPEADDDNPQGALQQRAVELSFPLLGANLIDIETNQRANWENLRSSTIVTRAGIRIGIIGVLTESTLATTIAANTRGMRIAPLAESITAEAKILRAAGVSLVVVVAHAGSACTEFDDPLDLSSCNMAGEIMRVAGQVPNGLVDHIVAGHQHRGIAHVVNGTAVTAAYSNTRAFSRVDFTFDRDSGALVDRHIFPPQAICVKAPDQDGRCTHDDDATRQGAQYEGRSVVPMADVVAIAERASELAANLKAEKLGVMLETPIQMREQPETAIGNLMVDALLQSNDADLAIHNVYGGIRAELPQGELTYGSVYRMFPFDNRVAVIQLNGSDVRRIISAQVHNSNRRAGFSGMRVFVQCDSGRMSVDMRRADGSSIQDADTLDVVTNDFLLLGGDKILTPVMPDDGFDVPHGTALVRDTLVSWFKRRGGRMNASEFRDPNNLRWNLPDPLPADCVYSGM